MSCLFYRGKEPFPSRNRSVAERESSEYINCNRVVFVVVRKQSFQSFLSTPFYFYVSLFGIYV